jgi:uncharacterized Zn finger protein (UPF0148 family)
MERSCPECSAPLVEIVLGDVRLRSCSTCDTREWLRADAPAGIDDVLRTFAEAPGGRRRRTVADAS